jgi:hypothetical protein
MAASGLNCRVFCRVFQHAHARRQGSCICFFYLKNSLSHNILEENSNREGDKGEKKKEKREVFH